MPCTIGRGFTTARIVGPAVSDVTVPRLLSAHRDRHVAQRGPGQQFPVVPGDRRRPRDGTHASVGQRQVPGAAAHALLLKGAQHAAPAMAGAASTVSGTISCGRQTGAKSRAPPRNPRTPMAGWARSTVTQLPRCSGSIARPSMSSREVSPSGGPNTSTCVDHRREPPTRPRAARSASARDANSPVILVSDLSPKDRVFNLKMRVSRAYGSSGNGLLSPTKRIDPSTSDGVADVGATAHIRHEDADCAAAPAGAIVRCQVRHGGGRLAVGGAARRQRIGIS